MADFAPPPVPTPEATPYLPEAATPDAFGAPVAGAAEQAGATMQAGALDAHRILLNNQYDADLSAAQVRAAQLRPQMQQAIATIQGDPDLKLPEYSQRVGDAFDQIAGQVTDDVANPKIARIMAAQVADMRSSYATEAGQWQTVQTAGQAVGQLGALKQALTGQAYSSAMPDDVLKLGQQWSDTVHSQQGLTPDQRSAIALSGLEELPVAYGQGLAYSDDPAKVRMGYQLYQSGWFAQAGVKGDQLHLLGRMFDSRMAHVDAQQKAQNEAAIQGFVGQTDQALATINAGGNVPMPQLQAMAQQARQLADAAQAAGKPKPELINRADQLEAALAKVDVNGRYQYLPPAQLTAMAEAAEADNARKVAAGQPVSLAEGAHVQALRNLANTTQAAVQSDPWSLATARGVAPAPLDPTNPQSYATRAMQAQQLQRVLQLPYPIAPLQKPEAEQLGKQAASSEQGRMAALATLDHFDFATRDLAARQVMPHDSGFVIEAGLDPFNREVVQQGRERASADPGFWSAKPADAVPGTKPPAQAHIADLNARVDAALGPMMDQTEIAGVKTTAANWIAGMLVRQGRSSMTVTDTDVQNGLRAALGGHVTSGGQVTGGIGSWGAPNNVYVVPTSMNAPGFVNYVNRQVTADRAKGMGPVNPDGTPFNLSQAVPVFAGNGTYKWKTPAGWVMAPAHPRQAPQPYLTRGAN
ncbi:hypothetical protein [Novosphingobium sp. FSW06-99]|uniref:hypothetical protein n=1 Tax=Novosphingobium sp. FSW06-99 TaxID=1739113 RepID=UPI00076D2F19|nr:hypothetical protein [Novosphingobium sp. FSW06-99]KUR80906.1 hypothetical protein AQZ49_02465 [Novosphingobium sp. FSW06-99]